LADARSVYRVPSISQNNLLHAVRHSPVQHIIPVRAKALSDLTQDAQTDLDVYDQPSGKVFCPDHQTR